VIVALIDSGLGLLPTAAWLRKLRPDLDLLLLTDPDGAPWGPKPEAWVIERVVGAARAAVRRGAEVVVLPCNTASVTALEYVRTDLGPGIPVVGTVPAIKPAAAACEVIAVWATAATTASRYQADLIARFAPDARVTGVACHGLADAIDAGDLVAARAAIECAAIATPPDVQGVVLGCTHYPLVADAIAAALPAGVRLFDSAQAVAAQTVRRIEELGAPSSVGAGAVTVVNSGRFGELPSAAAVFDPGRELGAVAGG
jgi:glutamate racemase